MPTVFADASALTAVIAREKGHEELLARLEATPVRLTSPVGVFETVAAVARIFAISPAETRPVVLDALDALGVVVREVPAEIVGAAQDAFERYGKGQRHPAQLNMGGCFAYACARHWRVPLLYKGGDFAQTDMA